MGGFAGHTKSTIRGLQGEKPLKLQVWDDALFTCRSGNEDLQASTLAMRAHVCEAMSSGVLSPPLPHRHAGQTSEAFLSFCISVTCIRNHAPPLLLDQLCPPHFPPSPAARRRHLISVQICSPDTALVLTFHIRVALLAQSIAH